MLDLFDGRRQLIVYHHMLKSGDDHPCSGCATFVDNVGHLAHLHARDTSLALVARAPSAEIEAFKKRMGWTIPRPPADSTPTSASRRVCLVSQVAEPPFDQVKPRGGGRGENADGIGGGWLAMP